jgi:hypothetical protein
MPSLRYPIVFFTLHPLQKKQESANASRASHRRTLDAYIIHLFVSCYFFTFAHYCTNHRFLSSLLLLLLLLQLLLVIRVVWPAWHPRSLDLLPSKQRDDGINHRGLLLTVLTR